MNRFSLTLLLVLLLPWRDEFRRGSCFAELLLDDKHDFVYGCSFDKYYSFVNGQSSSLVVNKLAGKANNQQYSTEMFSGKVSYWIYSYKALASRHCYFSSYGNLFIRFEFPCNSLKDSLQKHIMAFMKAIIKLSVFDVHGMRYVVSIIHFRQDFFYLNYQPKFQIILLSWNNAVVWKFFDSALSALHSEILI